MLRRGFSLPWIACLVLQVVSSVRIEPVAARRDFRERILADAGRVVTRRPRELRCTKLLRRIRRYKRFCHPTLRGAQSRIARRSRDTQAVHARTCTRRDEAADDHVLLEAFERIDLALDRGFRGRAWFPGTRPQR